VAGPSSLPIRKPGSRHGRRLGSHEGVPPALRLVARDRGQLRRAAVMPHNRWQEGPGIHADSEIARMGSEAGRRDVQGRCAMSWWPWLHRNLRADPNVSTSFARNRAVFARSAAPLRPMTVMVDARLRARAVHDPKVQYLLELLADAPVCAHLYGDDGPPRSAPRMIADDTGVEASGGWVSVAPGDRAHRLDIRYVKEGVPTRVEARTDDPSFVLIADGSPLAGYEPTGNALDRVRADAIALLVAKTIRADLFVTDRTLLARPESGFWWTTTVMPPEDALPVVGLYLRQQGRFVYARTPALGQTSTRNDDTVQRPPGWFYWEAASTLLPAAAERRRAVLPATLLQRVEQTLRARDRLLAAESVPRAPETVDDIQGDLDQILLWLMAAFDIAARVAHETLGLTGNSRDAGWQKKDWRKRVGAVVPELASLVRPGSIGHHVLTVIRLMRNSIHGEALSAVGFIVGPRPLETMVGLPDDAREPVGAAMDALGGRAAWGGRSGCWTN